MQQACAGQAVLDVKEMESMIGPQYVPFCHWLHIVHSNSLNKGTAI